MITKDMTVLEIVEKHPETEDVFRAYDNIIDKCILCNYLFDTINSIAVDFDIDLKTLMDKINTAIKKTKGI